jgi:hypothetical protein
VNEVIRVRLANPSQELMSSFPKTICEFYVKYSQKIFEILNKNEIQAFFDDFLSSEKITKHQNFDIRIMIFPSLFSQQYVCGTINEDLSQISLYPIFSHAGQKKIPACLLDFHNEDLIFIMTVHIVQTLVHEILHLKYTNEDIAEKKSTEYVSKLCKNLGYIE